jgi:hypothetical protein
MPTQRKIQLSSGVTMLGGFDYGTDSEEAIRWFIDGASESEGFDTGEVETTEATRKTWGAWVEVCRELWDEHAPTPSTGHKPEMPESFPVDCYHTWEGAGVGIDDGDRDYCEGMEAELTAMAAKVRYAQWKTKIGRAAADFRDEIDNAIEAAKQGC